MDKHSSIQNRTDSGHGPLPLSEPTLVMIASADPAVLAPLEQLLKSSAEVLDIRSNTIWTEVGDGLNFLQQAVNLRLKNSDQIFIGFAAPEATVHELLHQALLAHTLHSYRLSFDIDQGLDTSLEYSVMYQPIVSLSSRIVIGFESLIRAADGSAQLSAEELIGRAGTAQWLRELDSLGREIGIDKARPWLGERLLFLNVMAPGGSFDEDAVLSSIRQAAEAGFAPDQIVLEAVERNRYDSLPLATQQVEKFRNLGVRIAVDDVGDGYSSLRTVAAFKPDIVKIAGDLTREMLSSQGQAVVRAIVQLAHETQAWVVAENLETIEQVDIAARLGVDWGQGHFFGVPAIPSELLALNQPQSLDKALSA